MSNRNQINKQTNKFNKLSLIIYYSAKTSRKLNKTLEINRTDSDN